MCGGKRFSAFGMTMVLGFALVLGALVPAWAADAGSEGAQAMLEAEKSLMDALKPLMSIYKALEPVFNHSHSIVPGGFPVQS